jgi:quinoprotein dehydrogenase-associated probable ABC transporter substrate-binding protein
MPGPPRRPHRAAPTVLGLVLVVGCASSGLAQSPTGDLVSRSDLRVCADPNNLPFSNEAGEGFENKIAETLAQELSLPVKFTWFPQIIGFVRNTLQSGRCDLVIGTVAGDETMQTTTPYYYTSYVVVFRADKGLSFADFNDPRLKSLHIGVVAGTPPANLLVRYDLMANVRPYALTVDTRHESPTHQVVADVVDGAIDAAMLWGPIAGYYIHRDNLPLTMVRLKTEPDMPRMEYHIAMGMRANDVAWRRRINDAIHKRQPEITGILRDYGVPLLDELGNPLPP